MTSRQIWLAAIGMLVSSAASAQPAPMMARAYGGGMGNLPRAVIGLTTTSGANARDTLGLLVSNVLTGSPAEKAGIEEGDRVASVNGVSLRLAAPDVGDDAMRGVMGRRLTRELDRLKPGDDVELRLFANGQWKTTKVKTADAGDLYEAQRFTRLQDRPTLGLSAVTTGSARDTLGVFVMAVDDSGPAAQAGIEEGNRIASINGTDIRAKRTDIQDEAAAARSGLSRLERAISQLKPGEEADLHVYADGRFRAVKVKVARIGDLPRRSRAVGILGGGGGAMMIPPKGGMEMPMRIEIDGQRIGDQVGRVVDDALMGVGRGLDGLTFLNPSRVRW